MEFTYYNATKVETAIEAFKIILSNYSSFYEVDIECALKTREKLQGCARDEFDKHIINKIEAHKIITSIQSDFNKIFNFKSINQNGTK